MSMFFFLEIKFEINMLVSHIDDLCNTQNV